MTQESGDMFGLMKGVWQQRFAVKSVIQAHRGRHVIAMKVEDEFGIAW